jgi:hypothetical protein
MEQFEYDAFISHAVEDKIAIANELAQKLENAGLKIWYSGKELNAGDSLIETIHDGLNKSRFGIVIFSQNYLAKTWTLREFYHLLSREKDGKKVILPVLLDVTPEDLARKDLTMADRFAIKAEKGLDHVVNRLVTAIQNEGHPNRQRSTKKTIWSIAAISLLTALAIAWHLTSKNQPQLNPEFVNAKVNERILALNNNIMTNDWHKLKMGGAAPSTTEQIDSAWHAFKTFKSYYRNEYELTNGLTTIPSKKRVENALAIDLEAWTPANNYNLTLPQI